MAPKWSQMAINRPKIKKKLKLTPKTNTPPPLKRFFFQTPGTHVSAQYEFLPINDDSG